MHIQLPDPEPHRCPNLRMFISPGSEIRYVRCSGDSRERHYCHMEKPVWHITAASWSGSWTPQGTVPRG